MQRQQAKYLAILDYLAKQFMDGRVLREDMVAILKQRLFEAKQVQILADEDILPVLLRKMDNSKLRYNCGKQFVAAVRFVELFANQLLKEKFITKKQYFKLQIEVEDLKNDENFKLVEALPKLRNAKTKNRFRQSFLIGILDQEIVETSNDQQFRIIYQQFWRQCLRKKVRRQLLLDFEGNFLRHENMSEMLSEELIERIQIELGEDMGNEKEIEFNRLLIELAENDSFDADIAGKRNLEQEAEYLIRILTKFSGLGIFKKQVPLGFRVSRFGSIVSGFASSDADLDLTLIHSSYIKETALLDYLNEFLQIQTKQSEKKTGKRYKVEYLQKASIPLITVKVTNGKGFHGSKREVRIDILINNLLGVINSKFLSVYSQVRWIRNLGLLVKKWGKASGIISKTQLSSYAMVLLLISFLIRTGRVKIIIDARVRSEDSPHFQYRRIKKGEDNKFDVYYQFKTSAEDVTDERRVNLIQILKEFMLYYSAKGDHWRLPRNQQLITIDGSFQKRIQPQHVWTIKDPFDAPHNPGRVLIDEKRNVLLQFQQAYQVFRSSQSNFDTIKQLFAGDM